MEEIGLQIETHQENVINAVRQYVSQEGMRLIEECPLRRDMSILRAQPAPVPARSAATPIEPSRGPWRSSHLGAIFEAYFDYYFRRQPRRALIVGPTVGRWTAILHNEKAIDCRMLDRLSEQLNCRVVGHCFVEGKEYSYIEFVAGRVIEIYSSFLTDGGGRNFWSAGNAGAPDEGAWIAEGFLKKRYRFIPGFYDLPYLRGEKSQFACYGYSALPDLYEDTGNYPLSSFRYFYFHCDEE